MAKAIPLIQSRQLKGLLPKRIFVTNEIKYNMQTTRVQKVKFIFHASGYLRERCLSKVDIKPEIAKP